MSTVRQHLGLLWLERRALGISNPQYDRQWAMQAALFAETHLDELIALAGGADLEGWAGERYAPIPADFPRVAAPAAPLPANNTEQWELDLIGKPVEASMDGEKWFAGTLVEIIDLFTPYRVRLPDSETRTFAEIRAAVAPTRADPHAVPNTLIDAMRNLECVVPFQYQSPISTRNAYCAGGDFVRDAAVKLVGDFLVAPLPDLKNGFPYQEGLDIKAVLYTDIINEQQVCRDDLWLATTEALNKLAEGPAAPIQAAPLPAKPEQSAPPDILKELRDYAGNSAYRLTDYTVKLMRSAADEVERFYYGMMAFKKAAEAAAPLPELTGPSAGSIGDDADFCGLLVELCESNLEEGVAIAVKIIAYVDSRSAASTSPAPAPTEPQDGLVLPLVAAPVSQHDTDTAASLAALAFADRIINGVFEGGDWNGGEVQDMAVELGLLEQVTAQEPCGESCRCREDVPFFPAICYRKTYRMGGITSKESAETAAPGASTEGEQ